jgi:hypothetical protein
VAQKRTTLVVPTSDIEGLRLAQYQGMGPQTRKSVRGAIKVTQLQLQTGRPRAATYIPEYQRQYRTEDDREQRQPRVGNKQRRMRRPKM